MTTLGGGGTALARAWLSSRRTTSGSRNPIVADADAGVVGVVVVVDDRGFVRGDPAAAAAAALSMLSARPCPRSLCVFIRLPPAFELELAMLCALLGLRLAILGCTRGRDGREELGTESMLVSVSSPVPFPIPSANPSPSPTPLLFWPFLCCAEVCRPTERPIVRSTESSSSASLARSSSSSSSATDMGGGDADTRGFMIGSPNATVYRLRGVGLILDDLARVGCCGGAANVNPVRAGGRPAGADAGGGVEGAGRPTDTGRERADTATAPAGDADAELLVVGGD